MITIENLKHEIELLAPKFEIKKASLFGSYADGTSNEHSDVDILMEFNTSAVSLYKLAGIKISLEESMGKKVDVIHAPIDTNSFITINNEVLLYERS